MDDVVRRHETHCPKCLSTHRKVVSNTTFTTLMRRATGLHVHGGITHLSHNLLTLRDQQVQR